MEGDPLPVLGRAASYNRGGDLNLCRPWAERERGGNQEAHPILPSLPIIEMRVYKNTERKSLLLLFLSHPAPLYMCIPYCYTSSVSPICIPYWDTLSEYPICIPISSFLSPFPFHNLSPPSSKPSYILLQSSIQLFTTPHSATHSHYSPSGYDIPSHSYYSCQYMTFSYIPIIPLQFITFFHIC